MGIQPRTRTVVAFVRTRLTKVAGVEVCATIHVVANAVSIHVGRTIASTDSNGVQFIAPAITGPFRNPTASTRKHSTGTIADTTRIEDAHAIIHVVANTVCIVISVAIASTDTKCVLLVAVAITIALRDAIASTNPAFVKLVAIAVAIALRDAIASTNPALIKLVAIAVAIA